MKYALMGCLALLWFLGTACKSSSSATEGNDGTGEPVVGEVIERGSNCGISEPREVFLLTAGEWEDLWKQMNQGRMNQREVPAVDFDRYCIVACFMGTQNSGGHAVRMGGLKRQGEVLHATVVHEKPGDNCFVTMNITQPFVLVKVPREGLEEARFTVEEKVNPC